MDKMDEGFLKNLLGKKIRNLFRRKPSLESPHESTLSFSSLPPLNVVLERNENIPKDILSFFLPYPLEDMDLLLGRNEELDRLEKALKTWEEGRPASIALVGLQGSGKTSLVNCFLGKRPGDWRVLRANLVERLTTGKSILEFFNGLFALNPPVSDAAALIDQLEKAEPRIIVLEGVHNVFLRVLGGRKAAELFFHVILATRSRHLWLLTFRRLPWINMDRIFHVSRFFSHVVPVEALSEDILRDALNLRIEETGLKPLFFLSEEETVKDPGVGEEPKGEKQQAFFKSIFSNTGRNLYAALYFLLLCCRREADSLSILFWPPERLEVGFIKEMDRLPLLSLAEMAGHGALTVGEHERIFRMDGVRSGTVFNYLEQAGLISPVPFEGDGHSEKPFEISPVVHHHVEAVLEQLNLLY